MAAPSRKLFAQYGHRIYMKICHRHVASNGHGHVASNVPVLTISEAKESLMEMVGWAYEYSQNGHKLEDSIFRNIPKKPDDLPVRKIKDSYREVVIPLGSSPWLRVKYSNHNKGIRFGRLLEDLDTFAELICYTHNRRGDNPKSPLCTVTALVDRIVLGDDLISPSSDILLTGNVTWVGTSSMEVTMNVTQMIDNSWKDMIHARFVMVARNPITGESAAVNPVKPDGIEEQELFFAGEKNKIRRHKEAMKSLLKTPPDESERLLIHNQFLQTIDTKSSTFKVRVKPENTVWMEKTLLKNLTICHPQKKNLYNKIFGGYLMRIAFELAWANASLYSKSRPIIKVVDDIVFRKPVEIGSLLFLSSQVVFTKGSRMQVKVHAEVVDLATGSRDTTNNFHFTFETNLEDLPQVIPKTYAESMLYLDGKRRDES